MTPVPAVIILSYPGALRSAVLGLEDFLNFAGLDAKIISGAGQVSGPPDAVILPPAAEPSNPNESPALLSWLKRAAAQDALICSACVGINWVATAGLDAGRPVTTHWGIEARIRKDWPGLKVDTDRLVIEYSDLVTAGGMMAWVDLALIVIERLAGHQKMLETARHFVVDPDRRDQRRYRRFQPPTDHGNAQILRVQQFLEKEMQRGPSVAEIARHARLSPRSLQRKFTAATGLSLTQYLQELRVERAKSFLADSGEGVAQIAAQVGYTDVPAFHRVFQRVTGMTPAGFRKSVRSSDPVVMS